MKTSIAWPRARLFGDVESIATFVLAKSEGERRPHWQPVYAGVPHDCAAPLVNRFAVWCQDKPSNIVGSPLGETAAVSSARTLRASHDGFSAASGELFFCLSDSPLRGSLQLLNRRAVMVDDQVTKLHFALGTHPLALARKEK